ncbi:MAG: hydrolase [Clostridiales bacterium]|jgi:isopentenyl diphosphate isomerase/L-lactate dehydrogenase-like FMN-dependent dehydrogenase|nr:hydrolase [Clostridiales bacterium]
MANGKKVTPEFTNDLRKDIVKVPDIIRKEASGIVIFGKKIRSIIFTTDIAIIKNTNADAIIAVYPFTPHPAITQAIMSAADIPVLCGVGGGLTQGVRCLNVAVHAEFQGALGVVLNAPAPDGTVSMVKEHVAIPLIVTVVSEHTDITSRLEAGADIVNVSGGPKTAFIVRKIRDKFPDLPIIATGGTKDEQILETIEAGANAVTYTPPSNGELFRIKMEHYREQENEKYF